MTKDQAKALCQLLHIEMDRNRYAFYATARLFGYDLLNSTSQLEQVGWGTSETTKELTKTAVKMFRDMADALEA